MEIDVSPDFECWLDKLPTARNSIKIDYYDMEIFSDSSLTDPTCPNIPIHGTQNWSLISWGMPSRDISLETPTKKSPVLLALCTGERAQTLFNIETINIASGRNKLQPTLILPFYDHEETICPAQNLQYYLRETKTVRNCTENLFITYKKPIRNATAQTISRWIKTMLEKSDVDTSRYTAHSTCHASASAAARK
nr:unnamed protein product [Callosobruchus chinensis]